MAELGIDQAQGIHHWPVDVSSNDKIDADIDQSQTVSVGAEDTRLDENVS